MAVKIRLKRMGSTHAPFYRVVVMDSRTKRDGRAIEEIGIYQPMLEPSVVQIDSERALYWLGVGAQPTEQVTKLLKVTGDWEKFTGEKSEVTLKPQPEKKDKKALYEAAVAAANSMSEADIKAATTARKKKKADEAPAADAETVAVDGENETPAETTDAPAEGTEA